MKEEEFSDLCGAFLKASENRMDEVSAYDEKIGDDFYVEAERNKEYVSSTFAADISAIAGVTWIFAKYAVLAAGRYLPDMMGGEYCKEKCNAKSPDPLAYVFANHAARRQLSYGLHPMKVGESMPDKMKTKEALGWAEKNKLSGIKTVIKYYTDRQLD